MTPEHKDYLDALRESGVTNMWGAPAFLEKRFKISDEAATAIFLEWKNSFTK